MLTYIVIGICILLLLLVVYISAKPISMGIEARRNIKENANIEDFEHVISVINQFPTESFITHNVSLTEMIEDFDSWLDPESGVMKATVNFNS